jgi:Zn finger protein HypA/HybF involved in hydrogenase expression
MHEITIANKILEQIKNKDKVKSLTLEVGELAEITPEELKETLEHLTPWQINVNETPSIVQCSCGFIGRAKITLRAHDTVLFACPKCNRLPKIKQGKDIKLIKIIYN